MKNKILEKLGIKKVKRNTTTKLFIDDDNLLNLKVLPLPVKEDNSQTVVLNEKIARAYGINLSDKVEIFRANGEKFVCDVVISSKIWTEYLWVYENVVERMSLEKNEVVMVELTQASSQANDAIRKKMKWESITYDEMYAIIKDISEWKLSEIMMTYYVASSFFYPTTDEEMYQTAKAMAECWVMFKYPKWEIIADKHCIGGVPGNETTMIMIPILASLGIKMPKNFSKAITSPAATGECVNVLMDINFNKEWIEKLIEENNSCLVWWGGLDLAPADDKLIKVQYPLAMQSRAKVVSSIMAKKYAMWVTHSLIDIPVWDTAKVKTMEEALDWKQKFEYVGKKLWMKMTVQITPANEVIGNGVGAVLQVREVLRVLQQHDKRPLDLEAKAVFLAGKIIEMVGLTKWRKDSEHLAKRQLESWAAWKMMQQIIKAQNGKNPDIKSEDLKPWIFTKEVLADADGKIKKVDLHNINHIARRLGCPAIDEAGIYLSKRLGDKVKKWDVLFTMYATAENKIDLALEQNAENPAMTIG